MMNLWRQPLLHFLLMGALLFAVYDFVASPDMASASDATIRVDRESLLTYLQYRSRRFDSAQTETLYASLSDDQRQQLVERLVREEALYRQALEMGLDQGDYVIKQRLIQKMEFLAESMVEATPPPSTADLVNYYDRHRDEYIQPATLTFGHVFFDSGKGGESRARQRAELALKQLNAAAVSLADAVAYGDRFLYQRNYVDKEQDLVAALFGADMAKSLFMAKPTEAWFGPLQSSHGFHLIKVARRTPQQLPELDDIRSQVMADAQRAQQREQVDQVLQQVVNDFEVKVDLTEAAENDFSGEILKHQGEFAAVYDAAVKAGLL